MLLGPNTISLHQKENKTWIGKKGSNKRETLFKGKSETPTLAKYMSKNGQLAVLDALSDDKFRQYIEKYGEDFSISFLNNEKVKNQTASFTEDALIKALNQFYTKRKNFLKNIAVGAGLTGTGWYLVPLATSNTIASSGTALTGVSILGLNALKLGNSLVSKPDNNPINIQKLISMTDKGQTDSVKNMIQSYVDVNGTTVAEKRTVLQAAAKKGNTELVNFLIDAGADVDLADIEERTPLWFAAKHNNPFTAHALIKSGANLDTLSDTGENGNCSTPLWEAAANGHSNLVKLLLDSKADKNKKNLSQNLTPMQKASRNQHQQVVDLLREYGADDIDAIRARELREKAELQARQREITEATNQLKAGLLHGAKVATVCVVVPAAKTAAAAALCTIQ